MNKGLDRAALLNEFVLSPAMISAGAKEFCAHEGQEYGTASDAASDIFKVMVLAALDTDICHLVKALSCPEIVEEHP